MVLHFLLSKAIRLVSVFFMILSMNKYFDVQNIGMYLSPLSQHKTEISVAVFIAKTIDR